MVKCLLRWVLPGQTSGTLDPFTHDKAVWDRLCLGEHIVEQKSTWVDTITRGQILVVWVDGQPSVGREFLVGGGVGEVPFGAGGGGVRWGDLGSLSH